MLTLRIPVPAGARAAARCVLKHFEPLTRRKPGIALRNPTKTHRVCLVLILLGAFMAATGYALARARPVGDPLIPLLLIIGGFFLAIFASLLSFATFLLTRRASL